MSEITKLVLEATCIGADEAAVSCTLEAARARDAGAQQSLKEAAGAEPFEGEFTQRL